MLRQETGLTARWSEPNAGILFFPAIFPCSSIRMASRATIKGDGAA